jgi:hypothetical protein
MVVIELTLLRYIQMQKTLEIKKLFSCICVYEACIKFQPV